MHKMNSRNDGKNSKLQEFWKNLEYICTTCRTTAPMSCLGILHQPFPNTSPQWKEDCRRTHPSPFLVQILTASKLWSGNPWAKKKAKQETVSFFSFLIWKQLFMLSNRLFMTTGILVTLCRICTSQHCVKAINPGSARSSAWAAYGQRQDILVSVKGEILKPLRPISL